MRDQQASLDLGGKPIAGDILDRIRNESRDQAEKGRWFEQLFMRLALQQPEFEIEEIWRWPDWPEREALFCKHSVSNINKVKLGGNAAAGQAVGVSHPLNTVQIKRHLKVSMSK